VHPTQSYKEASQFKMATFWNSLHLGYEHNAFKMSCSCGQLTIETEQRVQN